MKSVRDVEWLDKDELRAWRALQFMQMRLEQALARQLAEDSQLSYADYLVMVALSDHEDGRLRLFELGNTLGWEKSRLSHQVARMADRGLVKREKCDSDRRGAFVKLTASGRRQIAAAAPGHVGAVRRLFLEAVSPSQLAVIRDAAESVLRRLDEGSSGE